MMFLDLTSFRLLTGSGRVTGSKASGPARSRVKNPDPVPSLLHGISQSKVDHTVHLQKIGQPTAPASQRGKHAHRPNAITEEQREHIRSYPAEKSHYSRSKNPNRLYLAPTLP